MRWLCLTSLALGSIISNGCALCCSPFDLEYATYGTKVPRMDQQRGRSGSPFSDPEVMGAYGNVPQDVEYEVMPLEEVEYMPEPMLQ